MRGSRTRAYPAGAWVRGATGKTGHVRTSDSLKTLDISSIEELDTRSMRLYTPHSSQLLSVRLNAPHAVSSRQGAPVSDFSAGARSGTRGRVRVAFGTQSSMEHRSFNGDARGKSPVKVLVDPPAAPICNRCRLSSGWGQAWSSRVCSDSSAVLTAAWPRSVAMRPSNRTVQRSTSASSSASPVHFGARTPEEWKKSSRRTRYLQ